MSVPINYSHFPTRYHLVKDTKLFFCGVAASRRAPLPGDDWQHAETEDVAAVTCPRCAANHELARLADLVVIQIIDQARERATFHLTPELIARFDSTLSHAVSTAYTSGFTHGQRRDALTRQVWDEAEERSRRAVSSHHISRLDFPT